MRSLSSRGASALILAVALAAGCDLESIPVPDDAGASSSSGSPCQYGFIGDPALEPEMVVTVRGADGVAVPIKEGGTAALILPPQGGRVVFAGVRANNVDACAARLTGALRDLESSKIMADARTLNLRPREDGTAGSTDTDISTFANIPVCPNQWATTDASGGEFNLEMSLKDRGGRTVKKTLRVTLDCAEPENEAQCKCICKEGYILGENCDADAGP